VAVAVAVAAAATVVAIIIIIHFQNILILLEIWFLYFSSFSIEASYFYLY
jgi:hypothetical protein